MSTPIKGFILYENKISAASEITASEEAAGYEDDYLFDTDARMTWRSQDDSGEKTILISFSSAEKINCIGFANHNFSASGTFTLKYGATTACTDGTFTLTMQNAISPFMSVFFVYLPGTEYTRQYWKIGMTEDTTENYLEIGTLYLGEYTEFDRMPKTWISEDYNHVIESMEHAGGGETIYDMYSIRKLAMEWASLSSTEFDVLKDVYNTCKKSSPFFFCLQPSELDEALYVRTAGFVRSRGYDNRRNLKWEIKELL